MKPSLRPRKNPPAEYGHLVEQMDRSGKVAGASRRLVVTRQAKQIEAEPLPLPKGPFHVIVADPLWYYENCQLPYPTMSLDAIKSLPVGEIAATDAIRWLWTTNTTSESRSRLLRLGALSTRPFSHGSRTALALPIGPWLD